jgi:hypothetical protein
VNSTQVAQASPNKLTGWFHRTGNFVVAVSDEL